MSGFGPARVLYAGLLAGALLTAIPSAATAASVSVRGDNVVFVAGRGEANDVTFSQYFEGETGEDVVYFGDAGARVKAGAGCSPTDDGDSPDGFTSEVTCDVSSTPFSGRTIVLRLGDRGDRTSNLAAFTPSVQSGGAGNDVLRGSDDRDRLRGGSGRDRLTGFGGVDRFAGGSGRDRINSVDFHSERISCGRGRDRLRLDSGDRPTRCERRRVAPRYSGTTALGRLQILRTASDRATAVLDSDECIHFYRQCIADGRVRRGGGFELTERRSPEESEAYPAAFGLSGQLSRPQAVGAVRVRRRIAPDDFRRESTRYSENFRLSRVTPAR